VSGARPLAILNPRSGGGRAGRTAADLRAVLERRLGPIDLSATERPGHAVELAREAVQSGRDLVIAIGGDGTLHEVANGVLQAGGGHGAAIGYVGQGTGGDFRRALGLEHRLDAYVEAIARGRDRVVDAGRARFDGVAGRPEERWFVNILSAGMSGLVDRHVASTTRVLGGTVAYYLASLRALAECPRSRLRCTVELAGARGEHRLEAFMIAICNGTSFGGGMNVAPMARPDDGRLEVIAMDAPSKVAFLAFTRSIYSGAHLGAPGVRHFSCDRVAIELEGDGAPGSFPLDVDGEALGRLPLEVEVVPGALRIRA
jgi:YegS/Rv2252/BmrU family lipid kinase